MPDFHGRTCLHFSVAENQRLMCEEILRLTEGGIDTTDDFGTTPLMVALASDFRDIAKLLLAHDPPPVIGLPACLRQYSPMEAGAGSLMRIG